MVKIVENLSYRLLDLARTHDAAPEQSSDDDVQRELHHVRVYVARDVVTVAARELSSALDHHIHVALDLAGLKGRGKQLALPLPRVTFIR